MNAILNKNVYNIIKKCYILYIDGICVYLKNKSGSIKTVFSNLMVRCFQIETDTRFSGLSFDFFIHIPPKKSFLTLV